MFRELVAAVALSCVLCSEAAWTQASTRPTDMSATPPEQVNPRPSTANPPPPVPFSAAQAEDTLRAFGYLNVRGLTQQPDGSWTARAQQQFDGPERQVTLDRDGNISVK